MSLSDSIVGLRTLLDSCEQEVKSLEGGKRASAPRCRLHLQNIKKSSHELRKSIMQHAKALPVRKRQPKKEPEPEPEPEPEAEPEAEPVKKTRKPRVKKEVQA
jgi:hypothetical protein